MSDFGWTRLAYLTITLAALAALVKLGALGAGALPEVFPDAAFAFTGKETTAEGTTPGEGTAAEKTAIEGTTAREATHIEGTTAEETAIVEEANVSRETNVSEGRRTGEDTDPGHDPAPEAGSLYENVDFEAEAPVFYRPASGGGATGERAVSSRSTSPDEKVCRNVSAAPSGSGILFPLTRDYFDSYDDTWGAARPQGGHEGTDLMVPDGTPEFAITDGTVVPVSGASESGWNSLGGYTVMIEADYSIGPVRKGDLFYYAHMNNPTDLEIGDTVKAGDVVGHAGDTGEGPEVTSGLFPPHLHFGWYDVSSGRSQLASGAMNPYPLLEWIKSNGGSIKGGSDIPYCEATQPADPTPATGGYWQFPSEPGVRPDMDTGAQTAAPSPTAESAPSTESSPDVTKEEPPKPADNDDDKGKGAADASADAPADSRGERTRPEVKDSPRSPRPGETPDLRERVEEWVRDLVGSRPNEPAPSRPDRSPRDRPDQTGDRPNDRPGTEDIETTAPPETTSPETTDSETTDPETTSADEACEAARRRDRTKDRDTASDIEEACPQETTHGDAAEENTEPSNENPSNNDSSNGGETGDSPGDSGESTSETTMDKPADESPEETTGSSSPSPETTDDVPDSNAEAQYEPEATEN